MSKMLKKAILIVLALVIATAPLTVGAVTPPPPPRPDVAVSDPVRGPSSAEGGMETALIAVRRLVDIDDNLFTEFSHGSTFSNWEMREGLIWNFSWMGDGGIVFADVTDDGVLLSFNMFLADSRSFGFAEISMEQAVARAGEFLRRANPNTFRFFPEPASVTTSLHGNQIIVIYTAQTSGFDFPASQIVIGIDKFTGEVVNYRSGNISPDRFRFEGPGALISESEAISAFVNEIGLTLEYRSRFDFANGSVTVFPVYTLNYRGVNFISALTGEVVGYVFDTGTGRANEAFADSAAGLAAAAPSVAEMESGARQVRLSPAELAAIEQMEGFLSSEEALNRFFEALDLPGLSVESFDSRHVSLRTDFLEQDRFIYEISLFRNPEAEILSGVYSSDDEIIVGVSGSIEAATGRVRSFRIADFAMSWGDSLMSADESEAAVVSFLERFAPDELRRTQLDAAAADSWMDSGANRSFRFVRIENGIPFRDNGISVTINRDTGRVNSFSLSWFDSVTFPSVANVLTPVQAMTNFVEETGSEVIYITVGEGNARLVYVLGANSFIDPFTGRAVDFGGEPLEDTTFSPDYSDVIGHWSERYVMRLLDNGVYNWSGRFEPNRTMNEVEFVAYIMQIEQPWARVTPQAFLTQNEINFQPSESRLITRQSAAQIIVEFMGFGMLAEQSRWFVFPFSDDVADEYKGFVTIAHMLDIVVGDAQGNFNATDNVTRAHAAAMLYNLVIARSR